MDKEQRNKIILIIVIVALLLFVIGIAIFESVIKNKNNDNKIKVSIVELYASDYPLIKKGDYFFGVKDNYIYTVVSLDGKELYNNENGLRYEDIFETRDGSFLVYNNENDNLNGYLFDGTTFINLTSINNVKYAKPIIYEGNDKSYLLAFCSNEDDNLYIYSSNVGIIVLNNTSLVADSYNQTDDVYYTNTEYLIVKNSKGLMGIVDINGNVIIDYSYKNILGLKNVNYIVVNKNDTYNVIDSSNNKLLKKDYQYICYKNNYYYVMNKNKVALYDNGLNPLSDFVMDHNIQEFDYRNYCYITAEKVGSKYFMWNNNGYLDFANNDLFVLANNKVEKKYNFKYIGRGDYLYTYEDGLLILYDDNFDEIRRVRLEDAVNYVLDIKRIENGSLYVKYMSKEDNNIEYLYINDEGKIYNNSWGKLLRKTDNYLVYKKNKEIDVINYEGERLNYINGENSKIYGDFLIINNNLYKIVIK